MNPTDIVLYISEGARWVGVGGLGYFGTMFACDVIDSALFHKKIQSQKELEQVVADECATLGIDPAEIKPIYAGEASGKMKKTDTYWELHVNGDWQCTKNTVRHELYHYLKDISKTNEKGELNTIYYYCIAEPRAKLYGTFGIKL